MRAHLYESRNEVTDLSLMAADIDQQSSHFALFGCQPVVFCHLIEIRYESLHERRAQAHVVKKLVDPCCFSRWMLVELEACVFELEPAIQFTLRHHRFFAFALGQ